MLQYYWLTADETMHNCCHLARHSGDFACVPDSSMAGHYHFFYASMERKNTKIALFQSFFGHILQTIH
jgi:hypothetical protein